MTRLGILKSTMLAALLSLPFGLMGAQVSPIQATIAARMKAESVAWGTLDAAKIKPFYSTDPTAIFFDLSPLEYQGAANFISGSLKGLAGYSSLSLSIRNDAVVHVCGPETAWATATVDMATVTKAGNKETMPIRWTSIWQKTGAGWLLVHEHWSEPAP